VGCSAEDGVIGVVVVAGGPPGGGGGGARAEGAGFSADLLATLGFLGCGGADDLVSARRLRVDGWRGAPSVDADLAPRGMERLTVPDI